MVLNMLGFLGFAYRAGLLIYGTFFCAIPAIVPLRKMIFEQDYKQIIPFLVGAGLASIAYFMFFRSLKRAKQFKQRHEIANEDSSFVEQEDSDDDVSYSQPSNQKNFDPKGGAF